MGIKISRNEEQDLTIHDVTGPVSEEEMYEALENFYKREPSALLLWDMSQADVSHVTSNILHRFIEKSAELGMFREGVRTAIAAPKDLQYGLARMSEAFVKITSAPFSFNAFRTREQALQWLADLK